LFLGVLLAMDTVAFAFYITCAVLLYNVRLAVFCVRACACVREREGEGEGEGEGERE
jgi:hypothetical protein